MAEVVEVRNYSMISPSQPEIGPINRISHFLKPRIALAPAILASIYMDLGRLNKAISNPSTSGMISIETCSLMHLVQAWAWERLQSLGPKPNPIRLGEPRLARWHALKVIKLEIFETLMDVGGITFKWQPYCIAVDNWLFNEIYPMTEEWGIVERGRDQAAEIFALLMRYAIIVNLEGFKEWYLPHRLGRQFGMDQDVPGFVSEDDQNFDYQRPFSGRELYVPPRSFLAGVSARYFSWWNQGKLQKRDADRGSNRKHPYRKVLERDPEITYDPVLADDN